jgi:hypothetical protein
MKDESKEEIETVDIINSYNNTDELIKKFPVRNPTFVKEGIEKKIQNRLLTGFENWNRGFNAWKEWGNILYTNDSIYNVHGARLTLEQYQNAMDITLKQNTILMGDFHNMLISDNYTAIYYDIVTIVGKEKKDGKVMEFVLFKDYGEELGTRVVEGWGGTKDQSHAGMAYFQGPEEKSVEEKELNYILNYKIPDKVNLKEKYPIKNPTNYIDDNAEEILNIILQDFDNWNKGANEYKNLIDNFYDKDAKISSLDRIERTIAQFKDYIVANAQKEEITNLYFDNILIRDNWAALHYRYRIHNLETNETDAGDRMQFLKFETKGDSLKIVASFIQ